MFWQVQGWLELPLTLSKIQTCLKQVFLYEKLKLFQVYDRTLAQMSALWQFPVIALKSSMTFPTFSFIFRLFSVAKFHRKRNLLCWCFAAMFSKLRAKRFVCQHKKNIFSIIPNTIIFRLLSQMKFNRSRVKCFFSSRVHTPHLYLFVCFVVVWRGLKAEK